MFCHFIGFIHTPSSSGSVELQRGLGSGFNEKDRVGLTGTPAASLFLRPLVVIQVESRSSPTYLGKVGCMGTRGRLRRVRNGPGVNTANVRGRHGGPTAGSHANPRVLKPRLFLLLSPGSRARPFQSKSNFPSHCRDKSETSNRAPAPPHDNTVPGERSSLHPRLALPVSPFLEQRYSSELQGNLGMVSDPNTAQVQYKVVSS